MNLPNALTLLRIFIVPILVVVLLTPFSENWFGLPRHIFGVALFLGAALTDYLDGHLARSRNQVTRLGQLLDPIADKLLISAALISLVENQLAPAWAVVIIIGREFAVTGLRSIAAADGVVICTPEYVFSLPGSLKNAIEWTVSTTVFSNKPVAIITASGLGEKAHEALQLIMKTIEATMLPSTQLLIQGARTKLNDSGEIVDEAILKKTKELIEALSMIIEQKFSEQA